MPRTALAVASAVVLAAGLLVAQTRPTKPLEIYIVDVEGGKADLFVGPTGETVLVDTGFTPNGGVTRDVDRIMEVIQAAGVTKLDYLISSHYHLDHVGGLQELVKRIPVTTFMDHGPTAEDGVDGRQQEQVRGFQAAYAEIYGKAKHTVLKVGDRVPLAGVDWRIVTSGGDVLKTPMTGAPGAGQPNAACAGATRADIPRDPDNGRSVGSVISYGNFRLLDFADLTRDKEFDLVCPNNPIGTVDLFFASNHGSNNANAPFFVHALQPRVAIAQNGSGKGGSADMFQTFASSPGFRDVWLTHWANPGGLEWNPAGAFIANGVDPTAVATTLTAPPRGGGVGGGGRQGGGAPGAGAGQAPASPAPAAAAAPPPAAPPAGAPPTGDAGGQGGGRVAGPGAGRGGVGGAAGHSPAHWIKVTVQPDGTFTVLNTRNNFSRTYAPVAAAGRSGAATGRATGSGPK